VLNGRAFLVVVLLVVAAGALALRLPDLDLRPLHPDESINTSKFSGLWGTGKFVYDPNDYHGPTLWYLTLPLVWASGARTYPEMTEAHFRVVPVLFSVGLILLLLLLHDALRPQELIAAAVLLGVSPAFTFYGRYYIHEMMLVFFTALAIGSGWRYARTGRTAWCLLCGVALALMFATKETWIIAAFAMLVALGLTLAWSHWIDRQPVAFRRLRDWRVLSAIGMGAVVAAIFFSSFFTNPRGPLDAARAYTHYFELSRASAHEQPFLHYLSLLGWHRGGEGYPVRTELFILAMAAVGLLVALLQRQPRPPSPTRIGFLRFLALYTIVTTLVYSLISYKTPWCVLTFLYGMILLAGLAIGFLMSITPNVSVKYILTGLLLLPLGHLAYQAWQINHVPEQVASDRYNPYVYSQPTMKFYELVRRLYGLAAASPQGKDVKIHIVTHDGWPLPFYLRHFTDVRVVPLSPANAGASIVIGTRKQQPDLERLLNGDESSTADDRYIWESHPLRPRVVRVVYIERSLWDAYRQR
jgi:uncharacterized protein (TIGR03663 family)